MLPKEVFDVPLNNDLLSQTVISYLANKRRKTAQTKDRSEVRGGGRKPWRQKGTGRARHGSIRSPLWRGGGVTFGPRIEKVFSRDIPKKARRKSLFMVLTSRAEEKDILFLDKLEIEKSKTKYFAEILNKLLPERKSVLIILAEEDKNLVRAGRNIAGVKIILAKDLNALDLLSYKKVIMLKDAIKAIEETFLK